MNDRIGTLYLTFNCEDLPDGEVELHPFKRWARIGAGPSEAEAIELARELRREAKSKWMGRGVLRVNAAHSGAMTRLAVRVGRWDRQQQARREEQLVRIPSSLAHKIRRGLKD